MPHFTSEGNDTYICQVCGQVFDCVHCPPVWRTDITGHESAGNVCPSCLKKNEEKTMQPSSHPATSYGVANEQVAVCKNCQGKIVWQRSWRTGSNYPTDAKLSDGKDTLPAGVFITARNWFHNCSAPSPQPPKQLSLIEQPVQPPALYNPTGSSRAAKVRAMRSFIDQASEKQLRAALKVIFDRQTSSEQRDSMTKERNDIGFGGIDADICSDIHKQAVKWGSLRGRQIDLIRKKMRKYSGQLVDALAMKEWSI